MAEAVRRERRRSRLSLRTRPREVMPGHAFAVPTYQEWSGRWESNPRLKLGKLGYYHYTTPARGCDSRRLAGKLANHRPAKRGRAPDGAPPMHRSQAGLS